MAGSIEIDTCYVCTYTTCALWGGQALVDGLKERLSGSGVRVKEYLCFGACAMAPNIILSPAGTWYVDVKLSDLDDIASHVLNGESLQRLAWKVNADRLRMALWMEDDSHD